MLRHGAAAGGGGTFGGQLLRYFKDKQAAAASTAMSQLSQYVQTWRESCSLTYSLLCSACHCEGQLNAHLFDDVGGDGDDDDDDVDDDDVDVVLSMCVCVLLLLLQALCRGLCFRFRLSYTRWCVL